MKEDALRKTVCYLCGHRDFNINDVHEAQTERTINDHENDLIPFVVCPGCGFTIEI